MSWLAEGNQRRHCAPALAEPNRILDQMHEETNCSYSILIYLKSIVSPGITAE